MMKFDSKYFDSFKFTKEQIEKNIDNALKDLNISKEDTINEVKFWKIGTGTYFPKTTVEKWDRPNQREISTFGSVPIFPAITANELYP